MIAASFCFFSSFATTTPPPETPETPVELTDIPLEELLEPTVSTATKSTEQLDDAPGSLTVITARQIADMNARTLREVLNVFIPGMDVVPTYFRYGDRVNEGIYSRGLLSDFSQQILILWNGQAKFNETTFGSPFPAIEFTLENVERIEVSRSPISLYGGGAFTVINIVTREQHMRGTEGSVDLIANPLDLEHAFQGQKFTGIWGKKLEGWQLGGSVQFYHDDGQAHRDAAGAGGYAGDIATLRDGTKFADNFTLSIANPDQSITVQTWYKYTDRDAFLSGLVPSQSNDLYTYRGSSWLTQAQWKPLEGLTLSAGSMLAEWANFVDFAGVPFGGDERNYDVFTEANYTLTLEMLGAHSLLFGAKVEREGQYDGTIYAWNGHDFDEDKDEAVIFAPNESRTVGGLYFEDNWQVLDSLKLLGGARADYFLGYGDVNEATIAPRFAVVWHPIEELTLKGLYASAVRPPSIYERFGTALVPLQGSVDIRSERVHTAEVSAIFKLGGLRAQVTPFGQLFQDQIEYVPNDEGASVATNSGTTVVVGADVDVVYYFSSHNYVFFNASKFSSTDETFQQPTFFLADSFANGGFNFQFYGVNLNMNGYVRGGRTLPAAYVINQQNAAGPHVMLNASLSYNIVQNLKVYVLGQNLTNSPNYTPLDFDGLYVPMRGFQLHTGLQYNLPALF